MIEEALGYTGSSRFVAFYSQSSLSGFKWCDSHGSKQSAFKDVWHVFIEHRRVHPFIEEFNLNSSDSDGEQWLLLDRVKREFLVGEASQVVAFLRSVPHEILSAEGDGTGSEYSSIVQVAMCAMVGDWLDQDA